LTSSRRKILAVVGTRPNFMKTAPVLAEMARRPDEFETVLVHTGQHYDDAMSRVFLEELGVGDADHHLDVRSGSHAVQVARVLERLEPVLLETAPDLVLVPGDVNSTLAAALAASQCQIPVGHIEAGLRSFDRTMPEETNRALTDAMSDLLFIHSPEARDNLLAEGCDATRIHHVGNTMIDTLVAMRDRIDAQAVPARHGLTARGYVVVTLHRPALVDGPLLAETFEELRRLAERVPLVFPAHPRTQQALAEQGIGGQTDRLRVLPPLGYVEFMGLVSEAAGVLTDSGGIQEETTYLGVPCFTLRDTTERPITVALGTNTLLGLEPSRIREIPELLAVPAGRSTAPPPLWDGRAAERLVDVLAERLRPRRRSATGRPVVPSGGHGR
jgi:UDP-N-acetylglucosamine 2-epimerase (non-hydrolysing)